MINKNILFIFLSLIIGFLGFFTIRALYVLYWRHKTNFIPQQVKMVINPPIDAIQAKITNLSGTVKKEGRNDNDFHAITKTASLEQGEELITLDNGSADVIFNNLADLILNKNTELDYLNGLPSELVVRQPKGTIMYSNSSSTKQNLSIRSLGLLTQLSSQSKILISTDPKLQTVLIKVLQGNATLGYSDQKNNTQVKRINIGQTAIFNYNDSTLTIQ